VKKVSSIKKYWDNYYKNNYVELKESDFAKFCIKKLKKKKIKHIIDVGSGNFRDSIFFLRNNYNVTALDINNEAYKKNLRKLKKFNKKFRFISDKVQNINKYKFNRKVDAIYARFFIHTISDNAEYQFLKWCHTSLKSNCFLLIETRIILDKEIVKYSTKACSNYTYEFEKGHFRRLIDPDKFAKRIINLGFKIRYLNISRNFSKIKLNNKVDNPILLRMILSK